MSDAWLGSRFTGCTLLKWLTTCAFARSGHRWHQIAGMGEPLVSRLKLAASQLGSPT
jgi:hypothetical protein